MVGEGIRYSAAWHDCYFGTTTKVKRHNCRLRQDTGSAHRVNEWMNGPFGETINNKAMLFARWQHHLRFCSGFPYATLKAMEKKISKWSRIQDSFRITPKTESLIVCAIPEFQKDPSITFWVILLIHRQTNRQTKSGKNITSLAEVINFLVMKERDNYTYICTLV